MIYDYVFVKVMLENKILYIDCANSPNVGLRKVKHLNNILLYILTLIIML